MYNHTVKYDLIIRRVSNFFYNLSPSNLFILLLFISIIKNGIWIIPNSGMTLEIVKNPLKNPFDDSILISTWLELLILYTIGFDTLPELVFFRLFNFIAFLISTFIFLNRHVNISNLKKSILLFFIFPIVFTSTYWLSYDSLTLLLFSIVFLCHKSSVLVFLIGILLGLQHFEIAFISFVLLSILLWTNSSSDTFTLYKKSFTLFSLLGILLGKLILIQAFNYYKIDTSNSRLDQNQELLSTAIQSFANIHIILWSFFGVGWFIFFYFVKYSNFRITMVLPFMLAFLVTFVVKDQTRIVVIITYSLILFSVIANNSFLSNINKSLLKYTYLFWLIIPSFFIWEGIIRSSNIFYNLLLITDIIFELSWNPEKIIYLPFDFRFSWLPT